MRSDDILIKRLREYARKAESAWFDHGESADLTLSNDLSEAADRLSTQPSDKEEHPDRGSEAECEEALRSVEAEYAEFRERTLAPIESKEGDGIQSLSWDDLLGIAVRNLNEGMRLNTLVRRAAPFVNAVAAMADDKTPALAWLADASLEIQDDQAEQGKEDA